MPVLQFPQAPRVVVRTGLLKETRIQSAQGWAVERHDPPQRFYFLDFEDGEGGVACVWDGSNHSDAKAAADEWVADGTRVVDEAGRTMH